MKYTGNAFKKFNNDKYSRVDAQHKLDFFYGRSREGSASLLLQTSCKVEALPSTKCIVVETGWREKDNTWTVSFNLKQADLMNIFVCFCEDIVESSRDIDDERKGVRFVEKRYLEWRHLLSTGNSDYLSMSAIKGLLGEMKFCLDVLVPACGAENAVLSWQGPLKKDQDFVLKDTWYEIKTLSPGSIDVAISSVEQLDSPIEGHLVIQTAESTTLTSSEGITLNEAFEQLDNLLKEYPQTRRTMRRNLISMGYASVPYYNQFKFVFYERWSYRVGRDFPALRRKPLPEAVSAVKYRLLLAMLEDFKE